MDLDVATLPWATLLTLASGYSGYFVANIGVREHHKTIDVTFSTLIFGFFGTILYLAVQGLGGGIISASIAAFLGSSILGALWAKLGRGGLIWLLRVTNVSHNDDLPTAFDALITETKTDATQLSVKVGDDLWLLCADVSSFADFPNGPFVFGRAGDILMYVTHARRGEEDYEPCVSLLDETWGTEVTYIPADKISQIDIRRKWRRKATSF